MNKNQIRISAAVVVILAAGVLLLKNLAPQSDGPSSPDANETVSGQETVKVSRPGDSNQNSTDGTAPANAKITAEAADTTLEAELKDWLELPLPDFGPVAGDPSEELHQAIKEAITGALRAKTLEEQAKFYEDFIDSYPLSADAIPMMGRLAATYARMGRFEDARRILNGAKTLAGNDRFVNTVEINMAHLDTVTGNLDRAEETLRGIMARRVPRSLKDPYAVAPQLFTAPYFLAKVYKERKTFAQADQVLRQAGNVALQMTRKNPDVEWLPSYVAGAYSHRINLVLEIDPDDIAGARRLAEELKEQLGDYVGPQGYGNIMMSLNMYERMRAEKKQQK
ncbi:MAG: hypothetical protein JSU94_00725 [Phycisphaerales bacterium]|nr:MAG: hypothetical protein JSU94_00725 [Phycisphaerales bacterium]